MTWYNSNNLPLPQFFDTIIYSFWRCFNASVAFRFTTSDKYRFNLSLHLGVLPDKCRFKDLPLHLSALPDKYRFSSLPLHLNVLSDKCRLSTFRFVDTYDITSVIFRFIFGARSSLSLLLKVSLRDSYASLGVWSSHHFSQGVASGFLRFIFYIFLSTVPIEQRDNPR